jgi:hypothetical protein
MKNRMAAGAVSFVLAASPLLADASYTKKQTVKSPFNSSSSPLGGPLGGMMKQLGGGEMMKAFEPTTETVMVHGNKMVTVTSRGAMIMDLDKKVWIQTDSAKREYSVMTFEQMSEMAERFGKMADPSAGLGRGRGANAPQAQTETTVEIKEEHPGTTKDVGGFTATQHIFTAKITTRYKDAAMQAKIDQTPGAAAATTVLYTEEVWTLQAIPPAYQAVQDFYRMAGEKMAGAMSPAARVALPQGMPSTPDAANGMAELHRRVAALPGLHAIEVTRMSMPIDMAAVSTAEGQPAAAATPAANSGSQGSATVSSVAQGAATSGTQAAISKLGGIGGAMAKGGFGGFGARKTAAPPAPVTAPAPAPVAAAAPAQTAAAGGSAGFPIFSETTIELGNFSLQPVSLSEFEVPAGYKQVPSPMERFLNQPGK